MIVNETHSSIIDSPVRQIVGKVELYNGSTLADTLTSNGRLKSFTIERYGEQIFFGFGISHKANIKVIDVDRNYVVTTENSLIPYFNDLAPYPLLYVTESNRDENTGELSITAYDAIYKASNYSVSELSFPSTTDEEIAQSYSVYEFASACASIIGASGIDVQGIGDSETCFDTYYEFGANFDGTETVREALDAVAEVTQTIYYLNNNNVLIFKRLDNDSAAIYTIGKEQYINLDSGTNRRLATIYHVTELGDDVYASTSQTGSTMYIRDNPFWDMSDDVATLVDNALNAVGGLTINQFNCNWRGNYLLEIGDKINLVTKDNEQISSYILNDKVTYNGAFSETSQWKFADNDTETSANPTSLGETLKKTYAKVDKVNRQIELVASESNANKSAISNLQVNVNNITSSVTSIEKSTDDAIEGITSQVNNLSTKIDQSASNIKIEVLKEISEGGITSVTTSTGFTFDEEGLTVEKENSDMSTLISEDGMTVSYKDTEMLVANSDGVVAANLHANTYLIIGDYSRFEDYEKDGEPRTGCFWIGQ